MPQVLVTRAPRKAAAFARALEAALPAQKPAELQLHCAPVLEAVPYTAEEWEETAFSLIRGVFSWVTFTSANGVAAFEQLARQLGQNSLTLLGAAQVAAVGTATEKALTDLGVLVDFVPEQQSAAGMVAEWPLDDEWEDPTEETLLLVQGTTASAALETGLSDYGYTTVTLPVYDMQPYPAAHPLLERTEEDATALDLTAAQQLLDEIDVLVATSPLILTTLVGDRKGILPPIVAIGASTEEAAKNLPPAVLPEKILVAASPEPSDLAAAVAEALS
ncbi:MAG: uroporphyrinogen-III synthase [Rothia sp. (in: high G+C Gram-positive bacteria)]|nr:uroporphyrinogen-III synthase [Rothia sp. (in: high G+C Gram-positive bacteria)]